jgi:serine/threonine protein kinase
MCDCLITVFGESASGSLVMEYLHQFVPLADPPSFDTCSRDVYPDDSSSQLIWDQAEVLVSGLLDALTKLHAVGICHGDFYGHNILCNQDDATKVKLSDFGAAFFYDRQSNYGSMLETVELRAFAILVEELLALLIDEGNVLKELALTCRAEASTFDKVHIWWKQRQLARLAKAFGADAF